MGHGFDLRFFFGFLLHVKKFQNMQKHAKKSAKQLQKALKKNSRPKSVKQGLKIQLIARNGETISARRCKEVLKSVEKHRKKMSTGAKKVQ